MVSRRSSLIPRLHASGNVLQATHPRLICLFSICFFSQAVKIHAVHKKPASPASSHWRSQGGCFSKINLKLHSGSTLGSVFTRQFQEIPQKNDCLLHLNSVLIEGWRQTQYTPCSRSSSDNDAFYLKESDTYIRNGGTLWPQLGQGGMPHAATTSDLQSSCTSPAWHQISQFTL